MDSKCKDQPECEVPLAPEKMSVIDLKVEENDNISIKEECIETFVEVEEAEQINQVLPADPVSHLVNDNKLNDEEKLIDDLKNKLIRAERQIDKLQKYNDDLRNEMSELSEELHVFRSRKHYAKDVNIQVTEDNIEEAYGPKPMPEWNLNSENVGLSIADSLKATAEAVLHQQQHPAASYDLYPTSNDNTQENSASHGKENDSGYIYDETSGFYYHPETGYYWEPKSGLFYDYTSGGYFKYDEGTGQYTMVSQTDSQTVANVDAATKRKASGKCADKKHRKVKRKRVKKDTESSSTGIVVVSDEDPESCKTISTSSEYYYETNPDDTFSKTTLLEKEKKEGVKEETSNKPDDGNNHHSDSSDSLATGESELMSSPESGELSSSEESDAELEEVEATTTRVAPPPPAVYQSGFQKVVEEVPPEEEVDDLADQHPPCIRVMVVESDVLDAGSLFIVTVAGGVIGRLKKSLIEVPDVNISKKHAEIVYDFDDDAYKLRDLGSQNGTFCNEKKLQKSKDKESTEGQPLSHGDELRLCATRLLLHIHRGLDTCDDCEPGQVKAKLKAEQIIHNDHVVLSKYERNQQRRREQMSIKKKYGLQNTRFDHSGSKLKDEYADKAHLRRKFVGSDSGREDNSQPASVHAPISTENKGHKLLSKMGWKSGEGLGRDNHGIAQPVTASLRADQKSGLGSQGVSVSLDNTHNAHKVKRWSQARQRYNQLEEREATQHTTHHQTGDNTHNNTHDTPRLHGAMPHSMLPTPSDLPLQVPTATAPSLYSPVQVVKDTKLIKSAKPKMVWVKGGLEHSKGDG